jgi:hypothetical protein
MAMRAWALVQVQRRLPMTARHLTQVGVRAAMALVSLSRAYKNSCVCGAAPALAPIALHASRLPRPSPLLATSDVANSVTATHTVDKAIITLNREPGAGTERAGAQAVSSEGEAPQEYP